jgi:hypothetical protein
LHRRDAYPARNRNAAPSGAPQYPEKLDALKKAWDVEARINLALPMDDRTAVGDAGDSRNRHGGAG